MVAGPCAAEFVQWRNCSRRAKKAALAELEARGPPATEQDAAAADAAARSSATRSCMHLFKALDVCVRTPGPKRDYYRKILPLDDRDVEPTNEELEKDARH